MRDLELLYNLKDKADSTVLKGLIDSPKFNPQNFTSIRGYYVLKGEYDEFENCFYYTMRHRGHKGSRASSTTIYKDGTFVHTEHGSGWV